MKKSFCLFFLLLFCILFSSSLRAQQITGTITGQDDGLPIPGATVAVKGTQRAVATDADGKFGIEATKTETLIISAIGYVVQEIPLGDGVSMREIVLKTDDKLLKEVTITGAFGQTLKKKALGYNVGEVSGDDVRESQRDNFLASLQGRVSGLVVNGTSGQPGASFSIQLRGVSSIGNSNSPLYVVDGLPIDNTTFNQGALYSNQPNRSNDYLNRAGDINPNDIETITVLKGPEAAALYGSQGASGAIIITTKKGSKGGGKLTYDNSFGYSSYYRLPSIQNKYVRGTNGLALTGSDEVTKFLGPQLPSEAKVYNNVDAFFGTGQRQNHNLTFEAGSDKLSYRLSTFYQNTNGIIPTSSLQNLGARLAGTAKLMKNLEITTSVAFSSNDISKVPVGDGGVFQNLYLWPSYDDVTNYLNPDGTRRRLVSAVQDADNPFYLINKDINREQTRRTITNVGLTYKPTDWLMLVARGGVDAYSTYGSSFISPTTNAGLALKGIIENYNETSRILSSNFLASAYKNFGDFGAALLVGATNDDQNYEVTTAYGENLFDPNFNSINNTLPTTQRNKYTVTRHRLYGVFSKLDLNYKSLVFVSVTGRNDWSSTLPVANNNYFYPSVNGAFILSELPAFKELSWLNLAKVRAAWSKAGKDAPPFRVDAALAAQTTSGGGFIYDFYGGNPNLKPEFVTSREFGIETQFLNRRVRFELTYFNTDRTDQIVTQRLSYGTGYIFGLINGGGINTTGYEALLGLTPIKTKDFFWDVTFNFTKLKYKILSLPADVPEFYNSDTWAIGNARASSFNSFEFLQKSFPNSNLTYNQIGAGSPTAIGGIGYERNKNGDILINPTTGLPVLSSTFLPIGDRNPDFTMGIQNHFSFKGFSLNFLLDIRKGGDVFNGNDYFFFINGLSTRFLDRATPYTFKGVVRDGKENSATPTVNAQQVTPLTRSGFYSAFAEYDFVERNINWLRIKDVTISYALPIALLSKIKAINALSFFVTGTDLYMWTNYTGGDPSVSSSNASTLGAGSAGFDYGKPGLPRSVSFGARITLQ